MARPAATADRKASPGKPPVPPEPQFWTRYSPHHEFPLSTVTTVATAGLAIGLLFLLWMLKDFQMHDRDRGPPEMQVSEIEGGSGGTDGPGLKGTGGQTPGKTEDSGSAKAAQADANPWQAGPTLREDIQPEQFKVSDPVKQE